MALWLARRELEGLISDLVDAAHYGRSLVVFPRGRELYLAAHFVPAGSRREAGDLALNIEHAGILELRPLLSQLQKAFDRGFEELAVLAEFDKMGLEGGNLEADLERMGIDSEEVVRATEGMDIPWEDITLSRGRMGMQVRIDLLVQEIEGRLRIPEYAVLVPKLLDNGGVQPRYSADASLLEGDFKRTVRFGDVDGLLVEGNLVSAPEMASSCIDFLYWRGEDRGLEHRCRVVSDLCQSYPAGRDVAEMIYSRHPELRCQMNHRVQLPHTVRLGDALSLTGDIDRLKEMGRSAYVDENLKKAIMEAKNLENLKEEMVKLGFSEHLIGQMEAKMAANEPRFTLYDELQGEKGRMEMALHFNQSRTSEYYYFNKFDLVRETQPPLAPGERYFVASQRQGDEPTVREFEMASLAVKEFNYRLGAAGEIRGAAQLYAGKSLEDSRELATMADGKIINVEKDFYKTLKNPAIGQTFYVEKGNGFTLSQAANLLSGRSVFREDILDIKKQEYSAWAKLDFDAPRDKSGNFHQKNFTEGYGFELPAVLDRFDFRELSSADKRAELEATLMNGDRAVVTVEMGGKREAILVEAVPEFKQVNLYSLEGKSIKREEHLKEEKIAGVGVGKDKPAKKEQEQGLGV